MMLAKMVVNDFIKLNEEIKESQTPEQRKELEEVFEGALADLQELIDQRDRLAKRLLSTPKYQNS